MFKNIIKFKMRIFHFPLKIFNNPKIVFNMLFQNCWDNC